MKYEEAGVSIEAGNQTVERIKKHVRTTYTDSVLSDIGQFSGMADVSDIKNLKRPVISVTTDGVGTKTIIAEALGKYKTLGFDIVHNCANDLLPDGSMPAYFVDYIASEKLEPDIVDEIVEGMAEACRALGVSILGGETAEMPDVYHKEKHDIVGTMIGICDYEDIIDRGDVKEGDALIGIPSSGLHTNGYSLARKIIHDLSLMETHGLKKPLGELLLEPHREYVTLIRELKKSHQIRGIAHITGGGLTDNVPRMLPEGLGATIRINAWERPEIFRFLQSRGNVPEEEMRKTFNLGIGLVICVPQEEKASVLTQTESYDIGTVNIGKGITYTNH
jgi:phosphoribosylformylglycinamidine cyclo-ligase